MRGLLLTTVHIFSSVCQISDPSVCLFEQYCPLGEMAKLYKQLGRSDELGKPIELPSFTRNCVGDALGIEGHITDPESVEALLEDDCTSIDPAFKREGDLLFSRDPETGRLDHIVTITKLSGGEISEVRSKEGRVGPTSLFSFEKLKKRYGEEKWEVLYINGSPDNDFKREEEQYNAYKQIIDHAIENPNTINKKSELTPAQLAVRIMVADQFKKATELSIQKANASTMDNAQKHLELLRTRRGELSDITKKLQGEKTEIYGSHSEMHQITSLEGTEQEKRLWQRYENLVIKSASYDFENTLMRTLLENNDIIPKNAQERKRRKKEASRIRKNAVEAMVSEKEQVNALDRFDNFVQKQEHTRDNLLQALNEWAESLQRKVTDSSWPSDFKQNATEYFVTLEKLLTPEHKGGAELILYNLFEQTSGVLETLAKADAKQAIRKLRG